MKKTENATTATARAAEALRLAGEDRRAALLAEIARQEAEGETETRAARAARAEAIAEARREARRTRETVALLNLRRREALAEEDEETAEALAARIAEAEEVREAAAVALLAIDPRARMTAADFLAISAERPEEAEKAIAAATYKAAQVMARHIKTPAAEIVGRWGEDARQSAYCDALAAAKDPARAGDPLALFLSRIAAAALAREKYGDHDGRTAPLVDLDYHPAGIVPAPEAATIAADILPRALALIDEEYRETAAAVARAEAAGIRHRAAAAALHVSPRFVDYLAAALRAAVVIIRAEDEETAEAIAEAIADRHARAFIDRAALKAAEALALAEMEARQAADRAADEAETADAIAAVEEARAALREAIAAPRRRSPAAAAERAETVTRAREAVARAEAIAEAVAADRHGVTWTPTLSPEAREAAALAREAARYTYRERVAMMGATH